MEVKNDVINFNESCPPMVRIVPPGDYPHPDVVAFYKAADVENLAMPVIPFLSRVYCKYILAPEMEKQNLQK